MINEGVGAFCWGFKNSVLEFSKHHIFQEDKWVLSFHLKGFDCAWNSSINYYCHVPFMRKRRGSFPAKAWRKLEKKNKKNLHISSIFPPHWELSKFRWASWNGMHKQCHIHLLHVIGLDCRLSCRQWRVGKQIAVPSEDIYHNKATLTGFLHAECNSNTQEKYLPALRKTDQRSRRHDSVGCLA